MLDFEGRVALITGAGRGIGRQHAEFLASRGAKIIVNDYGGDLRGDGGANTKPANDVVESIRAAGGEAMAACNDIGDHTQVAEMFDVAVAQFGRLDILIHNASVYAQLNPFSNASVQDLERIMRVNVVGGWNVAQHAWRHMTDQNYGRIVMTGSGAGFFGRRKDHAYSTAKSALIALTKVLATEGEAFDIKANLVGPIAWTENSASQGIPKIMEKVAPPMRVTSLVSLLAHEQCPVNGEMFRCGGGFVSRVFIAETKGTTFSAEEAMTPETVLNRFSDIMNVDGFNIPSNSDRAGAHVSASIAAANPDFAQALAEAKAKRRQNAE